MTSTDYQPHTEEAAAPKQKVFSLVPAEDSRTKTIIQARTLVCEDGELDYGARVLFTRLLDLSLNWYTHRADGVVVISVTKLCELLKCGPRTISRWNNQLVKRQHVWMTKQGMPNMWALNVYHISALDSPAEQRQLPTKDGLWGNGGRRDNSPTFEAQKGLAGQVGLGGQKTDFSNLPEKPCLPRTPVATAAGQVGHGERSPVATGRGQVGHGGRPSWPRGAVTRDRSRRPSWPAAQATGDHGQRSPVADNKETKTVDLRDRSFKGGPPRFWQAWETKLKKLYPKELQALKADLIQQQKGFSDQAELADLSLRIEAIDVHLYGAKAPKPKAARPARSAAPEPKQPTAEEIVEGALYLVDVLKKPDLLTAAQREALSKKGIFPPQKRPA